MLFIIAIHPKATSDVFIPVYCSRRPRDSPERFFRRDSPPRGGGGGGPRRRSRSRPRSLHMQKVWYHKSIHSRFLTIMNLTRQYPNSLTNDWDMSVTQVTDDLESAGSRRSDQRDNRRRDRSRYWDRQEWDTKFPPMKWNFRSYVILSSK